MAGADKVILYDPPGAIGLVDRDPVVMLGLDEAASTDLPADSVHGLQDLVAPTGLGVVLPTVTTGAVGRARRFDPFVLFAALRGNDVVSGSTLLTRDISIQTILSWNAAHQTLDLQRGEVIVRGLGTSASEYWSFGLRIDLVSAATFTGLVRWYWQDVAGVVKLQTGAQFVNLPGQFTMLTATRRWISPTSVALRYYVGDQLIGEVASVDGSIGGGTTGTTQMGARVRLAAEASPGVMADFLAADIDQLMILDRELCAEEIEATWLRITKYQPLTTRLFIENHDAGFPLSQVPSSDAALDTRMIGHALGFAAAQVENLRANFLPGRSYGTTLDEWEEVTRATQQHADHNDDDLTARRARVLARMRQRRGVSIPGIGDALAGLIGAATIANLEYITFSTTVTDAFTTLDLLRWDVTPAASWTAVAGAARSSPAAGTYTFDGTTQNWRYAQMNLPAAGREAHIIAKVAMTTPQVNLEVGLFYANRALGNYLLFGLRDVAGVFTLFRESFVAGVSTGAGSFALGANPANLWLHVFEQPGGTGWQTEYSTTSGTAGFTIMDATAFPTLRPDWAGMYIRSVGATPGAAQVNIDDFVMRSPFGTSALKAYVLLDQALGFTPDILGAQSVIAAIKHAYTHATFVTRRSLLCDDAGSGCDLGPLGGY